MASVRKRKSGGKVVWFVDYRADGKRHRIDCAGQRDAERVCRAVVQKLAAGNLAREARARREISSTDWCGEYLEWSRGHKSAEGYIRDEVIVRDLREHMEEHRLAVLDQIHHRHVQKYLLAVQGRTSASTANRYQHTVKKLFSLAVEYGYLTTSPATKIKEVKEPPKDPPRFFSVEELRQILWASVLRDPAHYRCLLFLVSTGARKGEAERITWDAVDLKRGTVTLRTLKQSMSYATRKVPLPRTLLEVLRWARKHDLPPVDTTDARRRLKRILGILGLRGGTLHTLRHTYASHLVQRGVSLYVVSKLLGHSNMKHTEIYSHLVPETYDAAVKVLPW